MLDSNQRKEHLAIMRKRIESKQETLSHYINPGVTKSRLLTLALVASQTIPHLNMDEWEFEKVEKTDGDS